MVGYLGAAAELPTPEKGKVNLASLLLLFIFSLSFEDIFLSMLTLSLIGFY